MIAMQNNDDTLIEELNNLASVQIFEDGNVRTINKGEGMFLAMSNRLKNLFLSGYLTPALGVSLHAETAKAMQSGGWMKLNFSSTQTKNGLPFDALVIRLENCYGFNIIREYNSRYDGRCLYFNLNEQTDLNSLISEI